MSTSDHAHFAASARTDTGRESRFRFADRPLRTKVLTLVVLAAAVSVSIGGVSQNALSASNTTSQTIVADNAVPALHVSKASRSWATYRRQTLRTLLARDEAAAATAKAELDAQEKNVAAELGLAAGANLTGTQRTELESVVGRFEAASTLWHDQLETAAATADTPQAQAAALARIDKEFVPLADAVSDGFTALVDTNEKSMTAAVADGKKAAGRSAIILWTVAILGTLLLALLGWWIALLVSRPVQKVKAAIEALAEGDLTQDAGVESHDEVGQMAAALSRAQAVLRESMTTIVSSSATLAGSAEELSAVSAQVAASAEETSVQSGSAAAAAEQVSRNVQTVAAATEQMSASIREISQSSTEAVRVAQSAAEEAHNATGTVSKLGDSSREIGDVVKVITSIAEQTNLLALNATIEAARAGEAGKGFAVVASEVKDLAQETARATEDISKRIEAIQTDSEAAVAAIARISEIIEEVNSYQTTIASAVEEQTATTSEMSRNVQEAANGAGGIAGNIEYVATAAQSSSTGIVEAQRAAAELAQLSGDLRELVSRYQV